MNWNKKYAWSEINRIAYKYVKDKNTCHGCAFADEEIDDVGESRDSCSHPYMDYYDRIVVDHDERSLKCPLTWRYRNE